MNKTMEYMAFGLPVIAFDLRERVCLRATPRFTFSPTTT